MILTYYPTHIRMSPWLIGIMFGYVLFKTRSKREKWTMVKFLMDFLNSLHESLHVFLLRLSLNYRFGL